MKQFLTALAANLVTIAVCVIGGLLLLGGIAAAITASAPVAVRDGSILVVDMGVPLRDAPARPGNRSPFDDALSGDDGMSLRAAVRALGAAVEDDRISGVLVRGTVGGDGYASGYAALRELRGALRDFHAKSRKPVHAFLVNPGTREYYLASAASTVTLDPFGALMIPGMSAEQVFLSGLLEKYGIGVQVSRVGRFKAAVEPFTRRDMSPENRQQTASYLGDMWSEVKRGIAESRKVDTVGLQALVDAQGIVLPADARTARLIDRVAYYDVVLDDLQRISRAGDGDAERAERERDTTAAGRRRTALGRERIPQVTLEDYAPIALARERAGGSSQAVALVYAEGDIVDGQGGPGSIGGDALARELRRVRLDDAVKAVVLRVNSPGGSAIASETMRRELALIDAEKPVVVSMGTVAASGGYWISTASRAIFAEPNTITGSIGVFALVPNVQGLANRNGITFDTVKTGRYADIFSIARPRSPEEMAVIQRGTDVVYDAFLSRVAEARKLSVDSVRAIADGRVWSGLEAHRIGLVDSLGSLDAAVRTAARLARITGDFDLREYPRRKSTSERLAEMLDPRPAPIAGVGRLGAERAAADAWLAGRDPARVLARDIVRELAALLSHDDPRGVYARMPFILRVR